MRKKLKTSPASYLYKRGKLWWLDFADKKAASGRGRQPCRTPRYDEARGKAQEILDRYFSNTAIDLAGGEVNFKTLHRIDCERARRKGMSERNMTHSIDYYWHMLREHFEPEGVPRHPATLTMRDIEQYIDFRLKGKEEKKIRPVSPQTYKREIFALKRTLKLAVRDYGFAMPIKPEEWEPIKSGTLHPKRKGKWREADLLDAFEAELEKLGELEARDLCIAIRFSGLRKEEAFRVTPEMIIPPREDSDGWEATLALPDNATKTRTPRNIPLIRRGYEAFQRQIARNEAANRRSKTVFTGREFAKPRIAANKALDQDPHISLRDLRHTFGTELLQTARMSLKMVMDIMGHSTLASAERYQTARSSFAADGIARLARRYA